MKGILKAAGGVLLVMAPVLSFLVGTSLIVYGLPFKAEKQKRELIEEYKQSEEVQEIKEDLQEEYIAKLEKGELSQDEYMKKVDEIESTSVTEEFVVTYGGEEINDKMNRINKELEEMERKRITGIVMTSAACSLIIPSVVFAFKLMNDDDYGLTKKEREKYADRIVIE